MTIMIDGFEVEIKARGFGKERYNKADTMYLLNTISLWAGEAAEKWSREGSEAIAKDARHNSNAIYKFLEGKGLYKDC